MPILFLLQVQHREGQLPFFFMLASAPPTLFHKARQLSLLLLCDPLLTPLLLLLCAERRAGLPFPGKEKLPKITPWDWTTSRTHPARLLGTIVTPAGESVNYGMPSSEQTLPHRSPSHNLQPQVGNAVGEQWVTTMSVQTHIYTTREGVADGLSALEDSC